MVEVLGSGDHEDPLAGELLRIAHAQLTAMDILPLEPELGRNGAQARGIICKAVAREIAAVANQLALDEIGAGNDRRGLVDAHPGRAGERSERPARRL